MALNDWECSFKGLTFGGDTDFSLIQISGLLDTPEVVSADHTQLRRHGLIPGDPFARGKVITFLMDLHARDESDFSSLVAAIRNMSNPIIDEDVLTMKIPSAYAGDEVIVYARPRRRRLPVDLSFLYKNTTVEIEFVATSPFVMSSTEITTNMVLVATTAGGRTYNKTYNRTYSPVSSGSSALMLNAGTAPADITWTFTGPLTKPKVTLLSTGDFLEFDITLVSGQQLIVDTASRTALLEGTASRRNTMTEGSSWWQLPATTLGSDVSFTAANFDSGTLQGKHRSTHV